MTVLVGNPMSFADVQNMVSAWGMPGVGRSLIIPWGERMLRFFLFMAGVMAASTGIAGDVSPCPVDTVPIQITTPGRGGSGIKRSVAEIPNSLPHFRAFVTTVTEHVAARLVKDKLCIKGAESMEGAEKRNTEMETALKECFVARLDKDKFCINVAESMESMESAERNNRSLLQFVHWPLDMHRDFFVPALIVIPPGYPGGCQISSPWIDLVVERKPVPSIRGVVRWNERQLLTDQAVLAGARNVPLSMAMPFKVGEYGRFAREYVDTEFEKRPATKPIEERVPPDLLWLFRRSSGHSDFVGPFRGDMHKATEKGAKGHTKLVLALIDRCFAHNGAKRAYFYYNNIHDAADLIPLEQYRIDMPVLRGRRTR
jgi:hypothetical protein